MSQYKKLTARQTIESKISMDANGCWLWQGSKDADGYGRAFHAKRLAHRVSYEEFIGPIPEGLSALHRCDVRCCVNPEHLFLGTQQDNMKDMYIKGRANLRGLIRGAIAAMAADPPAK